MFALLWPWVLICLPLPLLVRLACRPATPRDPALRVPVVATFEWPGETGAAASRWRPWLAVLVWLALVFAAARPVWLGETQPVPVSGRDIMLAVDLSGSMNKRDFVVGGRPVRRLAAVKTVAADFIARRSGDRLGLILFGAQAYVQTPLTIDRDTVAAMLSESRIGFAGRKTAIGDAIGLAIKRLPQRARQHAPVLVILSDGHNTAGVVDPLSAARLAGSFGIRIYTVGLGASRGTASKLLGTRYWDPARDLDERSLSQIAAITGGKYFRVEDTAALQAVYEELDRLEPVAKTVKRFQPRTELFVWPLAFALALTIWPVARR